MFYIIQEFENNNSLAAIQLHSNRADYADWADYTEFPTQIFNDSVQ